MFNKKVKFDDIITEYITYSYKEYDRLCIDHVLYRKAYNMISDIEIYNLYLDLDKYKLYEMVVNKESFCNNLYHLLNK